MQEEKGRSRKRKISSAKKVTRYLKSAAAGVLSAVMVFTGMPAITGITAMADEGDVSNRGASNVVETSIDSGTYGNSLPEAKDGVIDLTESVALSGTYVVSTGENVTINMNGYTITLADNVDGSVIGVDGGTLTLNGPGVITGGTGTDVESGNADHHYGGGMYIHNESNVTIDKVTITENRDLDYKGGGIYIDESTVTITDSVISKNDVPEDGAADDGGGIYINSGNVSIDNCLITENTAHGDAGIDIESGSLTLKNSTISNNHSASACGGVFAGQNTSDSDLWPSFIMENCVVDGNSGSNSFGAGIYITDTSECTIKNCTISNNDMSVTTMGYGGGFAVVRAHENAATPTITNCTIEGNSAYQGGGIYCYAKSPVKIDDCKIINNTANGGGGMYIWTDDVEITGTTITGNTATTAAGGGIYLAQYSLELNDGNILANNISNASASDIYNNQGKLKLFDAAGMKQVYEADGKGQYIDGWYEDNADDRYEPSPDGVAYDVNEEITDTVRLVASYSAEEEYFEVDEEIIPDRKENDRDSWTDSEEVSEYTSIEIEMSTKLPVMSQAHLNELTAKDSEFTMVFHNVLDEELKLDSEENTDLHITIGDKKIDHKYYSIEISNPGDVWTLSAQSASNDGCTFHVTVDLKALYEDEMISAEDFTGDTEIIVFFYADLEGAEYGEEYTSTVWYGVYDETDDPLHVSEPAVVIVSVLTSEPEPDDEDYGVLTVTKKVENNPTDTTSYKFTLLLEDEGTYDVETSENETVESSSNASRAESDSDALRVTSSKESAEETAVAEEYEYTIRNANNSKTKSGIISLAANTSDKATKLIEFELKDGQSMIVHGLPEGMKYTVTEISKSSEYTTSAKSDSGDDEVGTNDGCVYVSGIMEADGNVTVTYTNDYSTTSAQTEPGPAEEPFEFTKTSSRGETTVSVGTNLTYTISYKNDTDETATITIVDPLDAGLTYSSASDGGVYDESDRTVTWTIKDVKPGEEGSVTVTARVNYTGRTEGRVTNTAELTVEGLENGTYESNASTSNTVSRASSSSGGSGSSGSSSGSSSSGDVTNVNTGKTGHWILEGGYLTLPDGSHPSNEYLNVDGEVWAFYTYGYAVAKRHTEYYTSAALAAVGYIPEVTGTWETIGWWFEYDDGTYPHDEWAQLEYNGLTYWYHFDVDGWMDDGWFTDKNGDIYYLDPVYDGWRGHMMTGWQEIGGAWYYFSEDPNSLGVMLKDTTTPDGFKVDANGRWIE